MKQKKMVKLTALITNPTALAIQTAIGATALFYLQGASAEAIKWILPSIAEILVDLKCGSDAAKYRGETVRFSTARRRTGNKIVAYSCWIFVAASLKVSFGFNWIAPVVMGSVITIELVSAFSNYLETKNKRLNIKGLFSFIGKKTGNEGLENIIEEAEAPKTKPKGKEKSHDQTRNNSTA